MKLILELDNPQDAEKAICALTYKEPKRAVEFEPIKKEWFTLAEKLPEVGERVLTYHTKNFTKKFQINYRYEYGHELPDKSIKIGWKGSDPDFWAYLIEP